MRTRFVTILSAIAFLEASHAQAQQWNDLFQYATSLPSTTFQSTNPLPTTDAAINAVALNCGTASPAIWGGTLGGGYPPTCTATTETFINVNQFARQSDLLALQAQANVLQLDDIRENKGIAMSLAMAGVAYLQADEHIAFSGNWGTFQGQNGGAVGVAYRLSEHISVNAGFAGSFDGGTYGGRAGFRVGW